MVALFLSPAPLQAQCYKCVQVGLNWNCESQNGPCSQCADNCMEGFDTCTVWGNPCQWAFKPLSPDQPLDFQTLACMESEPKRQAAESR